MRREGTRAGLWPRAPAPGAAICPQGPQPPGASVPDDRPGLEPGPTRGVLRCQWLHRPRGWVSGGVGACPGALASYFPPLARPALLCPGSGPSRAAREPSGGGPPRFILRLALRAASWPEPPSGEARGSGRRAGGWACAGPWEQAKHLHFQPCQQWKLCAQ